MRHTYKPGKYPDNFKLVGNKNEMNLNAVLFVFSCFFNKFNFSILLLILEGMLLREFRMATCIL